MPYPAALVIFPPPLTDGHFEQGQLSVLTNRALVDILGPISRCTCVRTPQGIFLELQLPGGRAFVSSANDLILLQDDCVSQHSPFSPLPIRCPHILQMAPHFSSRVIPGISCLPHKTLFQLFKEKKFKNGFGKDLSQKEAGSGQGEAEDPVGARRPKEVLKQAGMLLINLTESDHSTWQHESTGVAKADPLLPTGSGKNPWVTAPNDFQIKTRETVGVSD